MAEPADPAGELTLVLDDGVVDIEDFAAESAADNAIGAPAAPAKKLMSAMLLGLAVVAALAVLVGWLGFRAYESHQRQDERSRFLQAARQCVLNLTTIDWHKAEKRCPANPGRGHGTVPRRLREAVTAFC